MFRLRIKPGTSPSPDKNYERQDGGRQGDGRQDDVKPGMKNKLAGDKVMDGRQDDARQELQPRWRDTRRWKGFGWNRKNEYRKYGGR